MAAISSLPVGSTGEVLETAKLATNSHREGMFLGSATVDAARAEVAKAAPTGSEYGLQAYILGNVTVTSSVLPAGAATSALQTSGNASLTSVDGKVPVLGQALAAASVPVVLTAAQLATLTPPTSVGITGSVAVTGTFFQVTQPVSIAATVAVSGPLTDTQLRATAVPISGTVTANAGTGTFAVSAAALPLPAGASTEATLALIKSKTDNLDVALSTRTKPADAQHAIIDSGVLTSITNPVAVTGGADHALTFAGDKADISGSTVTANAGTSLNTSALALEAGGNLALIASDIGTPGVGASAANTVLDRLTQLGVKIDNQAKVFGTEATLRKVLAALSKPAVNAGGTLLHR